MDMRGLGRLEQQAGLELSFVQPSESVILQIARAYPQLAAVADRRQFTRGNPPPDGALTGVFQVGGRLQAMHCGQGREPASSPVNRCSENRTAAASVLMEETWQLR